VFTVDKEINMTTSEHMDDLAQRYARALVRYHMTSDRDDYKIMFELHEMLNMVCHEYAQEQLEA
jgi:arginyl-tRNA synthetase